MHTRHYRLDHTSGRVCVCVCVCVRASHSVMCNSLRSYGLQPARLLCPWDSPGQNPGVGCHSFLQGIFLTQGLNPDLFHCRQILYRATREAQATYQVSINFKRWYHPKYLLQPQQDEVRNQQQQRWNSNIHNFVEIKQHTIKPVD